jgi:hypothetical protein
LAGPRYPRSHGRDPAPDDGLHRAAGRAAAAATRPAGPLNNLAEKIALVLGLLPRALF